MNSVAVSLLAMDVQATVAIPIRIPGLFTKAGQ
jgi:hypothetical protein